jgi:hypothetical protein
MHSQEIDVRNKDVYDQMLEVARSLSSNNDKNNPYIEALNQMRKRQVERE